MIGRSVTLIAAAMYGLYSLCACNGSIDAGKSNSTPDDSPGSTQRALCTGANLYSRARRLTATEYKNTVRAVFGIELPTQVMDAFPEDQRTQGFDNNVKTQNLSLAHLEAYKSAGRHVAEQASLATLVDCPLATSAGVKDEACHLAFIEKVGRRLYRRNLTDPERQSLLRLAKSETVWADTSDPQRAVKFVVRGLLMDPQFVLRMEMGEKVDGAGNVTLSDHEFATRLAFALWQEGPDDWLLAQADAGKLSDNPSLQPVVQTMLNDPRADRTIRAFAEQWLRVGELEGRAFSAAAFPDLPADFRPLFVAAQEEIRLLTSKYLLGADDARNLLNTSSGFVNADLAKLYGLSGSFSASHVEHIWDANTDRGGLLGTAAILIKTSHTDRTSVVHRGLFVREVLLCNRPPDPPPLAGDVALTSTAESRLSTPACSGCHNLMDPIGTGLEHFNAMAQSKTPVVQGKIAGVGVEQFTGVKALNEMLRASEATTSCMATQAFRFLFGTTESDADTAVRDEAKTRFEGASGRFKELLSSYLMSAQFRHRDNEICSSSN